jgi:hypothetical protein
MESGLLLLTKIFQVWSAGLKTSYGFQNFVDYANQYGPFFFNVIGNIWDIFVDLVKTLAPLGTEVLSGLQSLTSLMVDHWPGVVDTVLALGAGIGFTVGAFKTMEIIGFINALIGVFTGTTTAATAAQYGLNTAMLLNPVTWVIVGIGALIAIGIALWRNWDTVKEKAGQLWNWLKEAFGGIKDSTLSALQPVMDFFGKLMDKWDHFKSAISNFKMPKIGLPKILGGNGLIQKDGSHATGLSRVPFDGYMAELHKDEAVLTAGQSDALRAAGILSDNGSKPDVSLDQSGGSISAGGGGGTTFAPQYNIVVEGGGNSDETAEKVRKVVKEENEKFWQQMVLKQA